MRRKRSVEAAFRPVENQTTSRPSACCSRISASERRITCALKPPASPRSAVTGTIATFWICSRRSSSGSRTAPAAFDTPAISSSMRSAYGRIASMRCCDRRSRAEATSSIAFVTLRVFVIERTRRFRSCVEAKAYAALSSEVAKRLLTFSISAFSASALSSDRSPCSRIAA